MSVFCFLHLHADSERVLGSSVPSEPPGREVLNPRPSDLGPKSECMPEVQHLTRAHSLGKLPDATLAHLLNFDTRAGARAQLAGREEQRNLEGCCIADREECSSCADREVHAP